MLPSPVHHALIHLALIFAALWGSLLPARSLQAAAPALIMDSRAEQQALGPYLEILEDPQHALDLAAVRKLGPSAWTTNSTRTPTFGFSKSRYWLRFKIRNPEAQTILRLLEAQYSHYDFINFYSIRGESVEEFHLGDHQNFVQRPIQYRNFTVPLTLMPGSEAEIYISCDSSGTLFFPLQLWDPLVFAAKKSYQDHLAGYYYGLLIGMLVYNGFLYLTLRRPAYLYYGLYILGFFFFQMSVHGFAFHLLWPKQPWWANNCVPFFLAFSLFWVTLFTRDFIETARQTPRLHYGIKIVMVACVAVALLSLQGFYSIAIRAGTVLSLLSAPLFLLCGGIALYRGFVAARFYVLAFTAFLAGIIVNALMQLGVLETGFFTDYAIQMGSAIEVVLLSIALGHKIRVEQKAAHQAIAKLNVDLEQSIVEVRQLNAELIEKERARTMFFQNTSHELRTPLNGILGYLRLFLMNRFGPLEMESREAIGKIQNLAQSLLQQVNTILDLAKSRRGQMDVHAQSFRVSALSQSLDILGQGLQQRYPESLFSFVSEGVDTEAAFVSDPEKILTVCRNLLGNAFKFSRPDHPNHVRLTLGIRESGELAIEIKDEGIGIPADQIAHVFEEFYQVNGDSRRSYEGTGLGLAIVRQYLDLLKGHIEISSDLGQGTRMRVRIKPFELKDNQLIKEGSWVGQTHEIYQVRRAPREPGEPQPKPSYKQAHILVIDDNPTNCEVITEILRMQGYDASFSLHGKAGLDLMRKSHPDLVLLDMMMPEMSGEDVLKAIRNDAKLKSLPVILITARASEEDRILGLGMGADDYLSKPIVPDELCLRVRNTLERLRLNKADLEKQMIETSLAQLQKVDSMSFTDSSHKGELSILHYYQSAEVTGGDWYGVSFDERRQELYILLGDVTGHGSSSGLMTLSVAGAVRGWLSSMSQSEEQLDQITVLTRLADSLNELLYQLGSPLNKSMTMCFLVINLQSGKGTYLNAGHHPIFKVKGEQAEPLFKAGNPLGLAAKGKFGQLAFELEKDELIFLYTDGLIENRGHNGKHISTRELTHMLSESGSAEQLKSRLIDKVQVLWKDKELDDDVAFLIVRRQKAGENLGQTRAG